MGVARNARLTSRQLADFADRILPGDVNKLRHEAAALELSLPRYLEEIIRHRRADLIRQSVQDFGASYPREEGCELSV